MNHLEEVQAVLDAGRAAFAGARGAADLESARLEFLGKKGRVSGLMERIRAVPSEDRPRFGQEVNRLKIELTRLHEERVTSVGAAPSGAPKEDLTLPGKRPAPGALHPITQIAREVVHVFETLGFEETDGPEIEDEFHNFVALNIPP